MKPYIVRKFGMKRRGKAFAVTDQDNPAAFHLSQSFRVAADFSCKRSADKDSPYGFVAYLGDFKVGLKAIYLPAESIS